MYYLKIMKANYVVMNFKKLSFLSRDISRKDLHVNWKFVGNIDKGKKIKSCPGRTTLYSVCFSIKVNIEMGICVHVWHIRT